MHDNMLKLAMKDAFNQQDLARKAKLQVDLFQKAQEFAKEVGIQEMKAKQYANLLNENTKKAQYSRTMMFNVFLNYFKRLEYFQKIIFLFIIRISYLEFNIKFRLLIKLDIWPTKL